MRRTALVGVLLAALGWAADSQAQTCVAPPEGVLAWWPFDEAAGPVASDIAGSKPAVHFGSPIAAPGKVGGSLRFGGSTDFAGAGDSDRWAFGAGDFTIELWANFDQPGHGNIFQAGDIFIGNDEGPGLQNKWFFALGGGVLHFTVYHEQQPPPNFYLVRAPFAPVVGQWYHLAVTKSGQLFTIYLNGVAVGSEMSASPISNANAPLTIGQAESLGFMNGRLDEVTVYTRALSQAELLAIVMADGAGKCRAPRATAVVPRAGGDNGFVTLTLTGHRFAPASVVRLSRPGHPDIVGSGVRVDADGATLRTVVDLTGQARGEWQVVVSTPGAGSMTLADPFTIEAGIAPQVWVDLVGRSAIRVGQPQQFVVLYGNRGNVDALAVPIWIKGIPQGSTFTPHFPILPPPLPAGMTPPDWSTIPIVITQAPDLRVPLLVNRIPPGSTGVLPFSLTVPPGEDFALEISNNAPLVTPAAPGALPTGRPSIALSRDALQALTVVTGAEILQCGFAIFELFMSLLNLGELGECNNALQAFVVEALTTIVLEEEPYRTTSVFQLWWSVGMVVFECGEYIIGVTAPAIGVVLQALDFAFASADAMASCSRPLVALVDRVVALIHRVLAIDPNDKRGAAGNGSVRYVTGIEPMTYAVYFENLAAATAPAQSVDITDQLDAATLDLNTFELGDITFGSHRVTPPAGVSDYTAHVDLRPGTDLIVRIEATLNKTTAIARWRFVALDPQTGLPTSDPLAGFLPPNNAPPEGEGHVLFTIAPKAGLASGTAVQNHASIVFDANAPIVTPTWLNTIDADPPTSHVLPLPPTQTATDVLVSWQGSDLGSGVHHYTVYVSDNGGPFAPWLSHTTSTQGAYAGVAGHRYAFYSLAQDVAGRVEASKSAAEATIQLARTYHLAEGATGEFFDLDIAIANPNEAPAPVVARFLREDGTTVTQQHTVAAQSRTTIRVDDIEGLEFTSLSTVIESPSGAPLLVERTMYWDETYYGGHTGSAVDGPRTTWYFAEGAQGFFDVYVLLANPGTSPATATLRFLLESGAQVERTVQVLPTSRLTLYAGAIPELIDQSFSTVVSASAPVIAERAMYWSGEGRPWIGGHESAGVSEPATSWFHAEGATGSFFSTFVLVGNPNDVPAHTTFTYLLPSGVGDPIVRTATVAPHSRLTVNVALESPLLAATAVSTIVTSDVPVISERAMYWPAASWAEAHNSFGVTAPALRWGLAEGQVGSPRNFQTFILVANQGTQSAEVRTTFLREDGTTVVKTSTVTGGSRFNLWVNGDVPELTNERFAAVVESTNGVPISVERALYWDSGGQVWAGGTNATATRLP
jgi:hypothetical protein